MKTILVTGGAGYIGSALCNTLKQLKYNVIAFDNLSNGTFEHLFNGVIEEHGDILTSDILDCVKGYKPDVIIHLAALKSLPESFKQPNGYFETNVSGTVNVLQAATATVDCKQFIFASTSAVYGEPVTNPITEEFATNPINPYAETKLLAEKAIEYFEKRCGLNTTIFRFFNVAGASNVGRSGEQHNATGVVPSLVRTALYDAPFKLYGTDYPTFDGTAIRDYIHVDDLINAIVESINNYTPGIFNLGTYKGTSVLELINKMKTLVPDSRGLKNIKNCPRRPGDLPTVTCDYRRANIVLSWKPVYTVYDILMSAITWEKINGRI